MPSDASHLFEPLHDAARIQAALAAGSRLVGCLCAGWCTACAAWRPAFAALAEQHPNDCFVWIDIEDHADLVADIEVETLPVLLVQAANQPPGFIGPIEPRAMIVRALLQRAELCDALQDDPGVWHALQGDITPP